MPKSYSLLAIIISGALLRFYNLTSISLWHDESFSALLIRYPLGEMIQRIALDVHPPLYYFLLRAWDFVLGDSLLSLRLFSAFFGVLTVYFTYVFIKTAFKNQRLALISALLIAINPFQIQYAVEARMYTLGTFLIVFSSWLLVKAIESKQYKWWLTYGITAAMAMHTHYYLIFSVAAQAVFIIFLIAKNYKSYQTAIPLENSASEQTWKRSFQAFTSVNFKGAIIAYIAAFLVFLSWIGIFFKQLGQVEENYWIPKISPTSIPNTIWRMFAGSNVDMSGNGDINNIMLTIFSLLFLAILVLIYKREANQYKYLIILSFLVPFILAIGLSFQRSLYLDRYFVFAGLFYLMVFAILFCSIKNTFRQNIIVALFVLLSFGLFVENWKSINPAGKSGMKGASEYIFQNAQPDEKVFVGSTFIFFTYKYYAYQNLFSVIGYPEDFNPSALKLANNITEGYRVYPEYLTPLLYTPGVNKVDQLPHFSGTALLTTDDLLNDFSGKVRSGNAVWVLWTTGFGSEKPETPKNWRQIDESVFQDVFGYRGKIGATKYRIQ
jgi:mannosyltransferase